MAVRIHWRHGNYVQGEAIFMAMPIAATPVLKGDDARRFYKEMAENEKREIPDAEVLRGIATFNAIMSRNPDVKPKPGAR
jgi:hypothetical protein